MTPTTYEIYGLSVESALPLPELPPLASLRPDIQVHFADLPLDLFDDQVRYKALNRDEVYVFYRNVGTALVRSGREVLLRAAPGVDELLLRLYLLQQVIGVALLQRGFFVLHASAAAINGKAFAFAGASGQGKSTLAAALAARGGVVLTDDVLAVDMADPKAPLARAGLTHLKLTEESRLHVAPALTAQQGIADRVKRLCALGPPARVKPAPLRAIYLLAIGKELRRERIPPARAAVELVRHTYGYRLLPHIGRAEEHFRQSAALVSAAPVYRLIRPRDLSRMPDTLELIGAEGDGS